MKRSTLILATLAFIMMCIILLSGCTTSQNPNEGFGPYHIVTATTTMIETLQQVQWKTYTDSSLGISINYPLNWTRYNGEYVNGVGFKSPDGSASVDISSYSGYSHDPTMLRFSSGGSFTLEDFIRIRVAGINSNKSFDLSKSASKTIIFGWPGYKVGSLEPDTVGPNIEYFIGKTDENGYSRFYELHLYTLWTGETMYLPKERWVGTFRDIISSFKIS